MEVILTLPDELAADSFGDPSKIALEALAARAYEAGIFSVEQVRRMLDLPSRWEARDLLSRHGVWPGTTAEDLEDGLRHLDTFLSKASPAGS